MQYTASRPFRGNPDRALGLAEAALTGIGFRTTKRTPGMLEMTGPGLNSTRQSALVGASRILIRGGTSELAVEADLGGAAFMTRFVMLFPIGLALALGCVFAVLFGFLFPQDPWVFVTIAIAVGGNALVWLVLG